MTSGSGIIDSVCTLATYSRRTSLPKPAVDNNDYLRLPLCVLKDYFLEETLLPLVFPMDTWWSMLVSFLRESCNLWCFKSDYLVDLEIYSLVVLAP